MDAPSFDRLTRFLASSRSRRTLGGALLAVLARLLGAERIAAAACPPGRERCRKRCIPRQHCCTDADCRPAATGRICRRGHCVCPAGKKRCRNRCIPKGACCGCAAGQVCRQGRCCYPTSKSFKTALGPGGPATIRLCPGTTYHTDSTYPGSFVLQRDVTVVGAGATSTILDGRGSSQVMVVASGATVELRGVQIRNGHRAFGGGLWVQPRATATLRGCLVWGNLHGGGFSSLGALTLIDTVVSGNASHSGGGGLVTDNGADPSTLILRGATRIEGNQAEEYGGGLWVSGELTTVEMRDDSIVTRNTANPAIPGRGGGILNTPAAPATIRFFDRSRVTDNAPDDCPNMTCPS